MHYFTPEQAKFIAENVKGRTSNELTELVNQHFGLSLGINQIRAYKKNHGLKSGVNAQFKKGESSWNKGMKGINFGGENGEKTQFQKGHRPWNYKPVGTERVNGEGYVDIKIADPNKWKAKHILVWEAANGPVPKGHAVIFGDKNRRNFDLDNLILVSKKQLSVMNAKKLIQTDADLTKLGIVVADIYSKIAERKKKK